jgi:uncharacterized protein YhbP (UPF0306 family)
MTLSTTDLEGNPHAAPVYFVHDKDWRLYFFSDESSHHCQNFVKNHRAAAAIYPHCDGWQDIKGLQLHGEVFLVESTEVWEHAWEQYQHKFPFVRSLKAVVAQNKMYVFIPGWIRLVDNSQEFGFKKEWNLA